MRTVGRLVPPLATRRRFRAHSRFHSAFREASLGMAFVNVEEESFGQLLEVNPALCEITGYAASQLEATSVDALTAIADIDDDVRLLRALAAGEVRAFEVERRWQHSAGHHVWVMVSASLLHDSAGEPLCALLQLQDIDERKHLERQLEYLADHDPVTGLYNRRRFERELGRELAYLRRYGGCGAVLMIDLDDLKRVNDRFGHAAGDQLIAGVAGLLRARLRSTDVVARMGGDEFAVLVPRASLAEAERLAGELNEVVRESGASASIGVGCFDAGGGGTWGEGLLGADQAIYPPKEAGRDPFAPQPPEKQGRRARARA